MGDYLPVFKSENELVRKWVKPNLKNREYLVKKSVNINRILQKLTSEEALTEDEKNIEHPGQPDVDVVFWKKTSGGAEPTIHAAEVKYFRPTKRGIYPKVFYAGLDESEILLTYGFNYVYLWHFFDSEVDEKKRTQYRGLIQNLIRDANIPIGYGTWIVPKLQETQKTVDPLSALAKVLEETSFPYLSLPTENPLLGRFEVQKRRNVIRKALRII